MNLPIDDLFLRRFNRFILPVALTWSLATVGGIFLPQTTTEGFVDEFNSFFEVFRLGEKFALSQQNDGNVKGKLVTTTALVTHPHRIKAIYRSSSGSFAVISDGKTTDIVPMGGKYKKQLSLIGMNDTAAIFRGNDKTYRLRLGFDDPLAILETVTRSVLDSSQPGFHESEWRTIPAKTILAQIKDLQNIQKQIRMAPVFKGDRISGFKISSIAPNSVFARLGLTSGDILISVNNKKLLSYADAFNVYSQVPHMRSIQITVLRNNLQKDIVYEITR